MLENKIISIKELSKFGLVEHLNEQALSLVEHQKAMWDIAAKNFNALELIKTREFDFGHFKIKVQFNAERIRSTAAKTDAKSIAERPCFLCLKNLPREQKGILFQNKFLILTNPFPIFPKHLTLSSIEHIPQQILPHFTDLLELSQILQGFTVFYNGPKCGASAPDHFHFQAGNIGFLPIDKDFKIMETEHSEILFHDENSKIIAVENYLRRFIAIVSSEKKFVIEKFEFIHNQLLLNKNEEPMMNVLCNFIDNKWRVIIFPRNKQHPSHFFKPEEKRIIAGPAAVELGGVLILPRENDFKKITQTEVAEIYDEVTISKERFQNLIKQIKI